MTTISVISPTYNAERTILKTIKSVQQQTYKNLEIIVINDGLSDRTLELLETVADARLKTYSYPNGGLPTARNRGIERAQGEYISFIDADDFWTEDKLEKQLTALQTNPDAGVAYSWFTIAIESENNSGDTSFVLGKKVFFSGDVYERLLVDNFIGNGSNILIRSSVLKRVGNFDPTLKSCEDWDYFLRLASQVNFAVVPKYQVFYRKGEGTMSSKGLVMEREGLKVIDKTFQNISRSPSRLKNKSTASFYRYCGKIYIDNAAKAEDVQRSKHKLAQAISLNPLIIFQADTYILAAKILLIQLLPGKLAKNIISVLKKLFLGRKMSKSDLI
ncbi:MAG: glycosyltransferase [Bacteroidota bacterium]